jgi:endonuclease YncB( thermonuclease family)
VEPHAEGVTVQMHGLDKYGRTIADVILPDGTNVNHALVKDGWCWWYRKYAPEDVVLEGLEKGSTRGQEGLVGRSAAGAAVGVEEKDPVRPPMEETQRGSEDRELS